MKEEINPRCPLCFKQYKPPKKHCHSAFVVKEAIEIETERISRSNSPRKLNSPRNVP